MPETVRGNHKIYYAAHGRGEPLVLIRGLGSHADHWYAQISDFARHYRVITFDNRGIARSGDPGRPFSIQDMAEDTIGLMDALRIRQAHVLGLSMGGMIAQEMAIRYPSRVKGLILAVTHCGGEHQVRAGEEVLELILRMAMEGTDDARRRAAGALFSPQTIAQRPQVVRMYADESLKYPASTSILQRQLDAVAGHDTWDRLGRIQSPTLVLTAESDVLIPPQNASILANRIPGAELRVFRGGGHQILIEQPSQCNQAIIDFLRQVDAV